MKATIAVYGAYGHTGRFVVARLQEGGYRPLLCGRDGEKLAQLQARYPGLPLRAVGTDDADQLQQAFAGVDIVVNCAGPFLDTGLPVATAAVACGAHYLDLSAEQQSVRDLFAAFDGHTQTLLVPAAAFYGGLADLLASALLTDGQAADAIAVYTWLDSWQPTEGTRRTGDRNHFPRVVVREGEFVPVKPEAARTHDFPEPIGSRTVQAVPLSEIVTIARHLAARQIDAYLSTNSLEDLRNESLSAPRPADEKGRSEQQFCMEVRVRQGEETRTLAARGTDIYAVTAPLLIEAVDRITTGRYRAGGPTTLGEAFDAREFLQALDPDDVRVSEVTTGAVNSAGPAVP